MRIVILGRGKVGRALGKALGAAHDVRLRSSRALGPKPDAATDVVLLAVRDAALPDLVARLARERWIPRRAVVLHVAGSLGPDVLAPLRELSAGVGQAHPLLSFADPRRSPELEGALLLVSGDRAAVRRARTLGRDLGMRARSWPRLDPVRYHAAAALTANGAVALVAASARLLEAAGVPPKEAARALAPLLASVAANVQSLGLPRALTGPIARGDADTVRRHVRLVAGEPAEIKQLYAASGGLQLELAQELGDASPRSLAEIARLLGARVPRRPKAR